MSDAPLEIEVAYAEPDRGIVKELRLPHGSCVADALRLIARDPEFAEVDLENSPLGIFGRVVRRDHPLSQGDRIEIYRPLAADPKEARRSRAQEARKKPAQ